MIISTDRSFNTIIFECIDRGLSSIFGEDAVRALYFAAQQKFGVSKEDLDKRPVELIGCLEEILGNAGSALIEKAIIGEIRSEFNINEVKAELHLSEAIELAKKSFLLRN